MWATKTAANSRRMVGRAELWRALCHNSVHPVWYGRVDASIMGY